MDYRVGDGKRPENPAYPAAFPTKPEMPVSRRTRTIRAMNMASVSASWGQIRRVPSVGSLGQGVGEGFEAELGVGFEEGADDADGLGRGEGADRVDERAAGPDAGRGGVEDLALELGQAGDRLAVERPARVGVAPPGADGRARGVDQHAVVSSSACPRRAGRPTRLVVRLRNGLRRARRAASLSFAAWTSVATTTPLPPIRAARWSAFPPAPAQASHQRSPGSGSQARATACEARSWISSSPRSKAGR